MPIWKGLHTIKLAQKAQDHLQMHCKVRITKWLWSSEFMLLSDLCYARGTDWCGTVSLLTKLAPKVQNGLRLHCGARIASWLRSSELILFKYHSRTGVNWWPFQQSRWKSNWRRRCNSTCECTADSKLQCDWDIVSSSPIHYRCIPALVGHSIWLTVLSPFDGFSRDWRWYSLWWTALTGFTEISW